MRNTKHKVGHEYVSQNGYTYIKVRDRGFVLKHRYIIEQQLERPLTSDERVVFLDGNRQNLDPSNLEVRKKQTRANSDKAQLAKLLAKRDDIEAQILELKARERESDDSQV